MLTLFDLLPTRKSSRDKAKRGQQSAQPSSGQEQSRVPAQGEPAMPRQSESASAAPGIRAAVRNGAAPTMQQRYDALVRDMKARYNFRIIRWRSSMSGVAWQVIYHDGTIANLIEAPYPKGPMSAAIFLHEVGHHAIGLQRYKPRCLEEYMAWEWALRTMEERGLNVTDRVRRHRDDSLRYAVAKARRRGLKRLPAPLTPYL